MEKLISILDKFLIAINLLMVLANLGMTAFTLKKSNGSFQLNSLLGGIILTFSLTLLHQTFSFWGIFYRHPQWAAFPIYFSYWWGPLLFFFVKTDLFHNFKMTRKDLKHFILPIAQLVFFVIYFVQYNGFPSDVHKSIVFPYYGVYERFVYTFLLGFYLYFSSRIAKNRENEKLPFKWQTQQVFRMRVLLKGLNSIFIVHAALVLTDPIVYKLFELDLNNIRLFLWTSILTLTAFNIWIFIWSYAREFLSFLEYDAITEKKQVVPSLEGTIAKEQLWNYTNLRPTMFAKMIPFSSKELLKNIEHQGFTNFKEWIESTKKKWYSSTSNPLKEKSRAE